MEFKHVSVLLNECLQGLDIKENGIYVDCTLGGAGHSSEILKRLSRDGTLIGIDQDKDALSAAKKRLESYQNVKYVHSNFYNIDDKIRFVDVPGYGYAKVSKTERAKWGKMIEEYLTTRENLRVVVSLVDMRHEPSADDVQMYDFLKYYDIPVIIVATKADKIPRGKWNKHESMIKKKLDFDMKDQFVVFSSETRHGYDQAWDAILKNI